MDRRKFLIGTASVSAVTAGVAMAGVSQKALSPTIPSVNRTVAFNESAWRLKYQPSKSEKLAGTVIKDFTFPPGDARRYSGETKAYQHMDGVDYNVV